MHKTLEAIQKKKERNFFLIAGPCVLEREEMGLAIAEKIKEITEDSIFHIFSKPPTKKQTVRV
jgi:2-dehydro-3-deoxyphosphooctonate aldolase (KDO 8-P synthase)